MKPITRIVLLLAVAFGVCCTCLTAQKTSAPPTMSELLRILRITSFRVRTPNEAGFVWDLEVLKRDEVKPRGASPKGLTNRAGLLSMRETRDGVYEFTLPDRNGAYSQGDFDLCKEVSCSGQYSIAWLKHPVYSADGTQCLLGEFSNLGDEQPSAYIALVRVSSRP
jgi:hypothetical protein